MPTSAAERRRRNRLPRGQSRITIIRQLPTGKQELIAAKLVDLHERGCGIELARAVKSGEQLQLRGESHPLTQSGAFETWAKVTWCRLRGMDIYRAGIEFAEPVGEEQQPAVEEAAEDYYDVLQLSPKADLDTIHRVYRILAQRFHPDNGETGNEQMFRRVLEAYRALSDPEKRAAYDAGHSKMLKSKWRLMESISGGNTVEAERAKRQGILLLLYSRRVNNPSHPGLSTHEMEDLLGIPREHLEFSLWYLKEAGFVTRGDSGRVAITYKGVEAAELDPMKAPAHRMITAGDEAEKPAA